LTLAGAISGLLLIVDGGRHANGAVAGKVREQAE
jgi:hypothetical protein